MGNNLDALTTVFTEFYYWVTVVIMFLIHVGFCVYEVGSSRRRNHLHTLMKNTMLIPLVTVTFFFFGWWIYWAFPNGPFIYRGEGILWDAAAPNAPWSETMGTNLGDRITGVFWAAFLLFSWTAASIVSGSVIERIQSGAFWIIAVMIGSVTWIIDAAWGWHPEGWMVKLLGYHDAYASGVIHAIAGGTALGVLVVLGVVLFLLIYLVPQVTALLKTMGIELPIQTRILIGTSNLVIEWWPLIFGVPLVGGIVMALALAKSPRAQYLWDEMKLRLPVVGPILEKIILARFATFFALMYESGITVLEAMRTSEDIVGNRVIAGGLQRPAAQEG